MNFEEVKLRLGLWKAVFWCYKDLSDEELDELDFEDWENIYLISDTDELLELSLRKMLEIAKNDHPERFLDIYISTSLKKGEDRRNIQTTLLDALACLFQSKK